MKKLVASVLLVMFLVLVWEQAYPREDQQVPQALLITTLEKARSDLTEEEARRGRLQDEVSRLEAVLQGTTFLLERARNAQRDSFNSEVPVHEFMNVQRVVARVIEALEAVEKRLQLFRDELVSCEENVSSLRREIIVLEIEAEAVRLEETSSGK